MRVRQNILLLLLGLVLTGLSVWMQFGLLETPEAPVSSTQNNSPDYYIERFTSTGMDALGKKYELIADRMTHYPVDDRALLENPHVIQYDLNNVPRHLYAETGWIYNNRSMIVLTGNVRVVEAGKKEVSNTVGVEKMTIHLGKERG